MNQTFNFSRWWMLVTLHWVENRKRYGLAILAMAGLITGWFCFILAMDKQGPLNLLVQYLTYYCGLYIIGCLHASTIFAELGSKTRGIQYLSIPASNLEKLLCGIFFGVFLFFITYTLIFYAVDIPLVRLANRIIAKEHQVGLNTLLPIGRMEVMNVFNNTWAPTPDRVYHLFLLGYFAIQSAFLLGSVYFPRYSFIKTIVTLVLVWVLFLLFFIKGIEDHLPEGWRTYDFLEWRNSSGTTPLDFKLIKLPYWIENGLIAIAQYSAPLIFWFVTYFRLKEKEV